MGPWRSSVHGQHDNQWRTRATGDGAACFAYAGQRAVPGRLGQAILRLNRRLARST
jgi:hypothetical protein